MPCYKSLLWADRSPRLLSKPLRTLRLILFLTERPVISAFPYSDVFGNVCIFPCYRVADWITVCPLSFFFFSFLPARNYSGFGACLSIVIRVYACKKKQYNGLQASVPLVAFEGLCPGSSPSHLPSDCYSERAERGREKPKLCRSF